MIKILGVKVFKSLKPQFSISVRLRCVDCWYLPRDCPLSNIWGMVDKHPAVSNHAECTVQTLLWLFAVLDSSMSVKAGAVTAAAASPWDPVHTVSTASSNGAHPVTGGSHVQPAGAAAGIDDEFDLLSSRSKSPPNISSTAAGLNAMPLIY